MTGKLLVSYVVTAPAIAAVLLAGVLVNQVDLSITAWLQLFVTLVIGSLPFAALGLLIGYLFDADSAQPATIVSLSAWPSSGGLWAPFRRSRTRSLPSVACCRRSALPTSGRDAAAGIAPDLSDMAVLIGWAVVIGGLAAWRYRSSEPRAGG